MKFLKVILFVMLVIKGSVGFGAISLAFSGSNDCCVTDQVEQAECELPQEDESHGCCDDDICECLCCGNVLMIESRADLHLEVTNIDFVTVDNYNFEYHFTFSNGIWQPPKFI